jgi:Tfp pilus assembly protein PilP
MRRFSLLALVAVVVVSGCGGGSPSQDVRDRAVNEAMAAYRQAKDDGTNLSRGPCIAEQLPGLADWVADVAHDPRQPVDDVPANQCRRFRAGQAHHFVELDTSGRLIRAQ